MCKCGHQSCQDKAFKYTTARYVHWPPHHKRNHNFGVFNMCHLGDRRGGEAAVKLATEPPELLTYCSGARKRGSLDSKLARPSEAATRTLCCF